LDDLKVKQDVFTYTVSDGHGGVSTSTLSIEVFKTGGPRDTPVANHGHDTFLFRSDFGTNTIKNFDVHEDALQFDRTTFSSVQDILAHITDTAIGAVISDGHGDTVTLAGIKAAQLHSHDFGLM
jgi:hypothetical protein